MIRKNIVLFLFSLTLAACGKPPGLYQDADFAVTNISVPAGYQEVYRNVKEGFRRCGLDYHPDGELYTDTRQAHFDIFLSGALGGKGSWLYGMVDIRASGDTRSDVTVKVNKIYDAPLLGKPGAGREKIVAWAQGRPGC